MLHPLLKAWDVEKLEHFVGTYTYHATGCKDRLIASGEKRFFNEIDVRQVM